jgi:hypothetical protein
MIEPKMDFVEKVCNETWTLEDGKITVQPLGERTGATEGEFGMIWGSFGMILG